MNDEVILPNDDDGIFLSTQIQGKLDDLEEEAKSKDVSNLLQHLAYKPSETHQITESVPRPPLKEKKRNQQKATKSKPKPKKKAAKKLSVTDQMIRKLSGKPQKLKQMHLKDDVKSSELILRASAASSFNSDDGNCYEALFTPREWKHLKYAFKRKEVSKLSQSSSSSTQNKNLNLWGASTESPNFDMDDWNSLYGYQSAKQFGHVETDTLPAITLSQAFKSSQDVCEDENIEEATKQNASTEGVIMSQDGQISPNVSFSEVSFSSDEGSIIELDSGPEQKAVDTMSKMGTLGDPIELLSSQGSSIIDVSDIYPSPKMHTTTVSSGKVQFKGHVKMNRDSQHIISPKQGDPDEIPDSSDDEDDVLHIIQIIRQEKNDNNNSEAWEIPCSSDDDDNDNDYLRQHKGLFLDN